MRTIVVCFFFLILGLNSHLIAEDRVETKEFDALAKLFLKALKTKKVSELNTCWVNVDQWMVSMKTEVKAGRMSEKDLEKGRGALEAVFKARDAYLATSIPKMVKKLEGEGYDLEKLTFDSAYGPILIVNDEEFAEFVMMVFKHKATKINIMVHDASKMDGKWFFGGIPHTNMVVEEGGKDRHLIADGKLPPIGIKKIRRKYTPKKK